VQRKIDEDLDRLLRLADDHGIFKKKEEVVEGVSTKSSFEEVRRRCDSLSIEDNEFKGYMRPI